MDKETILEADFACLNVGFKKLQKLEKVVKTRGCFKECL